MKLSWIRLFAYWIDFMILACTLIGLQWFVYFLSSGFPFYALDKGIEIEFWVLLTMSLPVWLYFILYESFKQQTIGKRIVRLRVIDREGSVINYKQAVIRTCIKLLPWELTHFIILVPEPWWSIEEPKNLYFIYIPNILMIIYIVFLLLNKGTKGIHDYAARTRIQYIDKK